MIRATDAAGADPVIDGNGASSVIRIRSLDAEVTLKNIILTNGDKSGGKSGGIFNSGRTLDDVNITRSTANRGGGIFNKGKLNLINGVSMSDNTAT